MDEAERPLSGASDEEDLGNIIAFPQPDLAAGTLPWDADAHTAAWQQAEDLAGRDDDAALYLQMAAIQAASSQYAPADAEDDEAAEAMAEEEMEASDDLAGLWQPLEAPAGLEPFDAARFFESLSAEYGWLPSQIKQESWKTLLSYAREAELRHQREQKAMEEAQRNQRGGQEVIPAGMEEAHLRNHLPAAAIPWEVDDSPVG